jgi:hypothetical protein
LLTNQYVSPIALETTGWKFYCFYLGLLCVFIKIQSERVERMLLIRGADIPHMAHLSGNPGIES